MKRIAQTLVLATFLIFAASCGRTVAYTSAIQSKYKLTDKDLQKLQFYVSDDIILYKGSNDGEALTSNGDLIIKSDKQVDQVVIRKGTPGVVTEAKSGKLSVSFEVGEGKHLVFGSKYTDGEYKLQAAEWTKRHGRLNYGGQTYYARPGSGQAHLLLKIKKLEKLDSSSRTVSGRKVAE